MARPTARAFTATLAALAIGTLAACGDDAPEGSADATAPPKTSEVAPLDTTKVERAIKVSVRDQRGVAAKVTCPDAVRQARAVNFVCLAKTEEFGTTRFAVVQTDDMGHVQYAAEER